MVKGIQKYITIKYTLFVCCYIFWVASAVLIAVGIYAKVSKEKDVVDTLMTDPALLLIVIGSLMFMITFFGCFGALRNGTCLLKTFSGILVVILLLQITAAVLGFLFTDKVLERTEKLMRKAIVSYREDLDLENVIDFVQKKFQCCGVHTYEDWSDNVYFHCSAENPSLEACGVPFSCCLRLHNETVFNTMCGYEVQSMEPSSAGRSVYTNGCLDKVLWWGKQNLFLVGGITVGLLFLELCMITLASCQVSRIKTVQQRTKQDGGKYPSLTRDRLDSNVWYPASWDFNQE
ncbi:tetraspanin-33 [Oncorhynchus mykiss]|uniref:Tetraspanin n=1 Tax=Oncorhynchus mykiss TaxID=8022 RepID=A0A8C7QHC0_ONCMY|nr:tetraspanin-33 [Oncorhynchus mykiss]